MGSLEYVLVERRTGDEVCTEYQKVSAIHSAFFFLWLHSAIGFRPARSRSQRPDETVTFAACGHSCKFRIEDPDHRGWILDMFPDERTYVRRVY